MAKRFRNRRERTEHWTKIAIFAAVMVAIMLVREVFDISNWTLAGAMVIFAAGYIVGAFTSPK
jgi:uncharacterized membrane protein YhaH (DUF805 family)